MDKEIIKNALTLELKRARDKIMEALNQSNPKEASGCLNILEEPRVAAGRAVREITEAIEYYDRVKAQLDAVTREVSMLWVTETRTENHS